MSYGTITTQPTSFQGFASTEPINVLKSLDAFTDVEQLIVEKEIKFTECHFNHYRVYDSQKRQLFFVGEEGECCNRVCCKKNRGFKMRVFPTVGQSPQQEILTIERPFGCCKGCCWCADGCSMYPIFVKDANGQEIGMVRPRTYCCSPRFGIFDQGERLMYTISGQCCFCQGPCGCKADVNFPVMTLGDRTETANIAKTWSGCCRESFTDAYRYSLTVPRLMQVQHKALVFASLFMIDMTLYEMDKRNNNAMTFF